MKVVLSGELTITELQPNVADFLDKVSCKFDCPKIWRRESTQYPGTYEEFRAEPLPAAQDTDMFVSRLGGAIHKHVWADLSQTEHTWSYADLTDFRQGSVAGSIKLRADFDVKFGVPKGVPLYEAGLNGKSWLCWAYKYELGDGSTCFRLSTHAGPVWLRGVEEEKPRHQLHYSLTRVEAPPVCRGDVVVQLTETSHSDTITGPPFWTKTPWSNVCAPDKTGREWRITSDKLSLNASLSLAVVGRYNDSLKARQRHEVKPPYELVWERDNKMTPLEFS